jgi:small subunit ribosomal protein S6
MRRYESVVILDPEVADDDVRQFTERYTSLIKDHDGEIIKVEDWGKKRLAYLVKKRDTGRYILLDYVAPPEVINEVERNFKIDEGVLKYLSVKMDDDVDLEAFKAQAEEEEVKAQAKAESASDKASEKESEEVPAAEAPTQTETAEDTPKPEASKIDSQPESSDDQTTDDSEPEKEDKAE